MSIRPCSIFWGLSPVGTAWGSRFSRQAIAISSATGNGMCQAEMQHLHLCVMAGDAHQTVHQGIAKCCAHHPGSGWIVIGRDKPAQQWPTVGYGQGDVVQACAFPCSAWLLPLPLFVFCHVFLGANIGNNLETSKFIVVDCYASTALLSLSGPCGGRRA